MNTQILTGLHEIADRYNGFLLDLWGVLHDGGQPYPKAIECLEKLRAAGKKIALISNAPRQIEQTRRELTAIGFAPHLYDYLMTAGGLTTLALQERKSDQYKNLGHRCFVFGHGVERYFDLEKLNIESVKNPAQATFVLNIAASTVPNVPSYFPLLRQCAEAKLTMLCPDPDMIAIHCGTSYACAGTFCKHYEDMGGHVLYFGKPNPGIFEQAMQAIDVPKNRAIMIGDGIPTDIKGANATGIDCVLVAGGIHLEELGGKPGAAIQPEQLARFLKQQPYQPTYAMPLLAFELP